MNIYFAGSIRGGRGDAALYAHLIDHLRAYGDVLTEHVGSQELSVLDDGGLSDDALHAQDIAWLLTCDVLVAEVSTPSLGVGYEIGRAVERGKKVLCLYRPRDGRRLSAMIGGCPDVTNVTYQSLEDARAIIDRFFRDAASAS
jgi:nucleoside 2-deoxyribosyltransferase